MFFLKIAINILIQDWSFSVLSTVSPSKLVYLLDKLKGISNFTAIYQLILKILKITEWIQ